MSHDLDFMSEFELPHTKQIRCRSCRTCSTCSSNTREDGGMVTLKKRFVGLSYTTILPRYLPFMSRLWGRGHLHSGASSRYALVDPQSNPICVAIRFEHGTAADTRSETLRKLAMDSAASIQPIPDIQATEEKTVLQLVVQFRSACVMFDYSWMLIPPYGLACRPTARHYVRRYALCTALRGVLNQVVADIVAHLWRWPRIRHPVHRRRGF